MVNLHPFGKAHEAVGGGKGIDIQIDDFEKIRDDDCFEGGLKGVYWLFIILE